MIKLYLGFLEGQDGYGYPHIIVYDHKADESYNYVGKTLPFADVFRAMLAREEEDMRGFLARLIEEERKR